MAERRAVVRWCGGGVAELATPDYKKLVFVDAWFWNNSGFTAFGIEKPKEYASEAGFVEYVKAKNPESVLVALTHDHQDHMGDYFETLSALHRAGINVKTVGQADMMRAGLVGKLKEAGLDPAEIVLNGGAGANIGGTATWEGITIWVVPAVHSTFLGFPAVGFVIEVGGVRFYASGDTDVYGDLRLVGERYQPDVALVCASNGPFTMGPDGAALAVEMLGSSIAIPYHYAHNPRVRGPEAGQQFADLVKKSRPSVQVHVIKPGESVELALS